MSNTASMYWPISNNFGDLIGPYICHKLTDRKAIYAEPTADYEHYIFGGSVLNHAGRKAIAWGAGIATITDGVNPDTDIRAVRGPITRARVLSTGRRCPAVYGDPGLLMPMFHKPAYPRNRKIGLVPHYVDQYRAYERYGDAACVINVLDSIESVIDEICSCQQILSSSLHGIIIAHAYGIPATWVKISDSVGGDGTKFRDYFASVGLDIPEALDLRNAGRLPDITGRLPEKIDTTEFMKACPIPNEFRKPEYRQ
jgi:pyruvyltransferase